MEDAAAPTSPAAPRYVLTSNAAAGVPRAAQPPAARFVASTLPVAEVDARSAAGSLSEPFDGRGAPAARHAFRIFYSEGPHPHRDVSLAGAVCESAADEHGAARLASQWRVCLMVGVVFTVGVHLLAALVTSLAWPTLARATSLPPPASLFIAPSDAAARLPPLMPPLSLAGEVRVGAGVDAYLPFGAPRFTYAPSEVTSVTALWCATLITCAILLAGGVAAY
ncbi:hypothetical protein EON68_04365, partial [archaeon]